MIMLRYGKLLKMIKLSIIICHCRKETVLIPIGTALRKSTVRIIAKVMCMAKRTHGKEVVGQALIDETNIKRLWMTEGIMYIIIKCLLIQRFLKFAFVALLHQVVECTFRILFVSSEKLLTSPILTSCFWLTRLLPCFSVQIKHKNCKKQEYV